MGSDQPKFCSMLRREVRKTVQKPKEVLSKSRPVSVYMIKPRFCPSRDQSSPVQSSRPWGFGHVLSDQPAASRLEHCRSPGCDVGTTGPMPYRPDY
ncbi:hypothetical protein YC2023_045255 [Brassica napus]